MASSCWLATLPTATTVRAQVEIDCHVCEVAIAHLWQHGETLRLHCLHVGDEAGKCKAHNIDQHAVTYVTRGICEEISREYVRDHLSSAFQLIKKGDRAPTEDDLSVADATTLAQTEASCRRWLHDTHGADAVARVVLANLEAGKDADIILKPLQSRYCKSACQRKSTGWAREDL